MPTILSYKNPKSYFLVSALARGVASGALSIGAAREVEGVKMYMTQQHKSLSSQFWEDCSLFLAGGNRMLKRRPMHVQGLLIALYHFVLIA